MSDPKDLKRSKTLYRHLMENSIDAVYLLDEGGKVLDVNKAACSMLGYSRMELLELYIDAIDPDFSVEHFREFWKGQQKDASILFQTRHRHKNGYDIPVEVNGLFFEFEDAKYHYGIARDLTRRNLIESTLLEEKTKLQNVISAASVGTWEWDIQSGETSFDSASAALLGYTLDELQPVGMEIWMGLKAPEDRSEASARLDLHVQGKTEFYEFESRMKHKNGNWVWILGRGKVITWTHDGKPLKMFGIHSNVTDRKLAEEALLLKNTELEMMLKEVHHRIKNNLHTVQSLLSLKENTLTDPDAISALEDSRSRLRSMMVLYDKLYRASDLTAMSIKDYLSTLVDEILENYPTVHPIKVTKILDDFVLDMKRLQSLGIIVNELLTNIFKYAFPGRSDGEVTISVNKNENLITMMVQDNGCGIQPTLELESVRGFGLQLVNGLTTQLNGTLNIDRSHGTRIAMEFAL